MGTLNDPVVRMHRRDVALVGVRRARWMSDVNEAWWQSFNEAMARATKTMDFYQPLIGQPR